MVICPKGGLAKREVPRRALVATLLLGIVGSAWQVHAKVHVALGFAPSELWSTAVRLLRVDLGYTIREKDAEVGYVLFEFTEGQRRYRGSLELVPVRLPEGREQTQVVISLPDLPRHYETLLGDKLAAKVKEELGTPPPAPRRRAEEPKRHADAGFRPRPRASRFRREGAPLRRRRRG